MTATIIMSLLPGWPHSVRLARVYRGRGPARSRASQRARGGCVGGVMRPSTPAGRMPKRDHTRARNSPPARHPAQQRRSASSARPHARRAADICARSGGSGLGHVGRGGCGLMFCPCFLSQTCRSMAEHLPMAGSCLPILTSELPKVERRLCFSSPRIGTTYWSWRHAWAGQLVVQR